jgi:hypothetical protein
LSKNDKGQAGKAVDTYDVYLKGVVIDHAEVYGDNAEKALKEARKQFGEVDHSSFLLVNRRNGAAHVFGADVPFDRNPAQLDTTEQASSIEQAFERSTWKAEALIDRISDFMLTEDVAEEQEIPVEEAYASRDFEGEYNVLMWIIEKAREIQDEIGLVSAALHRRRSKNS